jgi:uncharacterized protein DUF1559
MKQIGLALQNYHDKFGCFPPAYTADAGGRPMHSWRVLILPYMDATHLYQQYRFDESWDGPNNSKLANQMPPGYQCPTFERSHKRLGLSAPHLSQMTNYVAVVGIGTVFDGSNSASVRDLKDGTSNTVLVIEARQHSVHWMQPDDISVNELIAEVHQSASETHTNHVGGKNFLLGDGSVRFVSSQTDPSTIRALSTIAGGETVSDF